MMAGVFFPGAGHVIGHQVDPVHIRMQRGIILHAERIAYGSARAHGQGLLSRSEVIIQRLAKLFQQQGIVGPVIPYHRIALVILVLRLPFHAGIFPVDIQAGQEGISIQRFQTALNEGSTAFLRQRHFREMAGIRPSADGDQDLLVRIFLRALGVLGEMRRRIVRVRIRPRIGGYDRESAVLRNDFPEGVVHAVNAVPRQTVHVIPAVGIDIPVREINRHPGFLPVRFSEDAAREKRKRQDRSQYATDDLFHCIPSGSVCHPLSGSFYHAEASS